jgi:hypothetical protein
MFQLDAINILYSWSVLVKRAADLGRDLGKIFVASIGRLAIILKANPDMEFPHLHLILR